MTDTTFIKPGYRKTSAGHKPIDGVQFHSYRVGILRYMRISADGQIMTQANHRSSAYSGYVIGHGAILNNTGKTKRFQSEIAAARAAVKKWKELQAQKVLV